MHQSHDSGHHTGCQYLLDCGTRLRACLQLICSISQPVEAMNVFAHVAMYARVGYAHVAM